MKLICTQENLNRGLEVVSRTASKNVTLPILNNVLLKAEKGTLKLITTNLELGITCLTRSKIEKEGAFTVRARILNDLVGLLTNEKINLEVVGDALELQSENSRTKIKGLSAEEFPLIPELPKKNGYSCQAKALRLALTEIIFAVAIDESRPEISGVFMGFKDNKLTLAATDSYRLAEKTIRLDKGQAGEKSIIVPVRTLQELLRVLAEEVGEIEIYFTENQILFCWDEVNLVSRLIEGQYPDYQQIIPKESKTKAIIMAEEFTKLIKGTSLFCKPGINDLSLDFDPKAGKIILSAANSQLGENVSELKAKLTGEPNKTVFNYRYLLDGLVNMKAAEVSLEIINDSNPGLLKPVGEETYLYIIMPIKQ